MRPFKCGIEACVKRCVGATSRKPHEIPRWAQRGGPCSHQVAQLSTHTVAPHRITRRSANGIPHVGARKCGVFQAGDPESVNARIGSFPLETPKDVFLGNSSYQAERRWRPLARRDFSTARPARVLIR